MSRVPQRDDDDIPLFDRAQSIRQRREKFLDDPYEIERGDHMVEMKALGFERGLRGPLRRVW